MNISHLPRYNGTAVLGLPRRLRPLGGWLFLAVWGVTLLVAASSASSQVGPLTPGEQVRFDELYARPLQTFSNPDLAEFLDLQSRWFAAQPRQPSPAEATAYFALKAVGQPYRLFSVNTDLKDGDCVTFTQRCLALSCTGNWDSYYRLIQRLTYKDGVVDVLNKNLFPLADWVPSNAWLLADMTSELGVPVEEFQEEVYRKQLIANMRYGQGEGADRPEHAIQLGAYADQNNAVERVQFMQQLGLPAVAELRQRGERQLWIVLIYYPTHADAIWALPAVRQVQPNAKLTPASLTAAKIEQVAATPEVDLITEHYIDQDYLRGIAGRLQTGDIFLVVRRHHAKDESGHVYCDHMGVIVLSDQGEPTVVHSIPPQVRQEPLRGLLDRCKWIAGLKILRLQPSAPTLIQRELARVGTRVAVPSPEKEDERINVILRRGVPAPAPADQPAATQPVEPIPGQSSGP